jgi:tryptophanyl-tRNA synthetase
MSKSALNPASRIVLSDSADEISQKIRKAVTDSNHNISYDPAARPGISNLLRILHECRLLASSPLSLPNPARSGVSIDTPIKRQIGLSEESHLIQEDNRDSESSVLTLAAALQSAGAQTPQFKEVVVEAVNAVLLPIRQEFTRYRADEAYLIRVAEGGAKRARAIAQQTMRDVKGKVGLGYL